MKIPHREIREDEQELLDHIWSTSVDQTSNSDTQGFEDLGKRIQKKVRQRRFIRIGTLSGVAAVVMAAGLFFWQPTPLPTTEAYAQLRQMGVKIDRQEVVLTTDDGMSMTLDSSARIEQRQTGAVALLTGSGEQKALSSERQIKIEVPAGRQLHMTLADGTQVWLNAGSTLEYPATFENKTERRVRLTGEAFFEVERNEKLPFYVELGNNETIRVLGTSFNVNAYHNHTTTLLSGKVSYDTEAGTTALAPNQQLCRDCTSGTTTLKEVDAAAYGAWKEGWIWFEAEKLSILSARLSRIYGITIAVDDRFREYTFSGKIHTERGIEYILSLVTETTPITCEVKEGVIRLK